MAHMGDDHQRAVESVMRAIDLVEERMMDDMGAGDMAAAAYYSNFYFSRLFSRATGHAPYDYLMRRRIAVAAEQVVATTRNITDIALDFGFEVPETFARAFRRCFGCLPSEARKLGSYRQSIARTRIDRSYVEAMLTSGWPIVDSFEVKDMIIVGEWHLYNPLISPQDLAAEMVMVIERDHLLLPKKICLGSRSTEMKSNGTNVPYFPLSATAISGGVWARFKIQATQDLERILEFAYRVWIPTTGYSFAPPYDLIEAKTDEWCLFLPLRPLT